MQLFGSDLPCLTALPTHARFPQVVILREVLARTPLSQALLYRGLKLRQTQFQIRVVLLGV